MRGSRIDDDSTYTFDHAGRLTGLTYSLPSGYTGTAPVYAWTYDDAGRVTDEYSRADTNPSDPNYQFGVSTTWAHAHYNYDSTGQLATTTTGGTTTRAAAYSSNWQNAPQVGGTAGAEDYAYDANGNRAASIGYTTGGIKGIGAYIG